MWCCQKRRAQEVVRQPRHVTIIAIEDLGRQCLQTKISRAETIVEVPLPQTHVVEKAVEVPQGPVDVVLEKIVEVPRPQVVEKVVEVPRPQAVEKVAEVPVYICRSGKCFHMERGCVGAFIAMSEAEAQKVGRSRCERCGASAPESRWSDPKLCGIAL